jgi:hypothetical protein
VAGLLTYPDSRLPSHPFFGKDSGHKPETYYSAAAESGFTAAGTVPDFHRIPKLSTMAPIQRKNKKLIALYH